MHKKFAFTLVELIVVITILAILSTIAFLSFNGYAASARDSARLTDLDNLAKALEIAVSKTITLPRPSSAITLTASGTPIGYQGYADKSVLGTINMSDAKDPIDGVYYTYSTNAYQNKYQVLGFLENADSIAYNTSPLIDPVYAEPASYTGRTIVTKGNGLGILLESTKLLPVQVAQQNIDTATTATGYISYFDNKDITPTLTGNLLFSSIYNRRKELLQDKTLAQYDPSLVGYWDMETTAGPNLKDWSNYHNDGSCYNGGSLVNCGIVGQGPQIARGAGKTGMATIFDGVNDFVDAGVISMGSGDYTISTWISPSDWNTREQDSPIYNGLFILYHRGSTAGRKVFIMTKLVENVYPADSSWAYWGATKTLSDIPDNIFYHLVGVKSGNKLIMYVNGVKERETTALLGYTVNTASLTNFWIGKNTWNTFKGGIDETRVYNRTLSDSEISALYNATK